MAAASCDDAVWDNLVQWIENAAGHVNGSLELRVTDQSYRGVFARQDIAVGTLLIRLPSSLVLSGAQGSLSLPSSYLHEQETRTVSPWLKCLTAYYQATATSSGDTQAYIASLPVDYETVWKWSDEELAVNLAGTNTTAAATAAGGKGWSGQGVLLRQRYRQHIRPYLLHCGVLSNTSSTANANVDAAIIAEDEYNRFETACQCLSTRGFHLTVQENSPSATESSSYTGPFLLPWIDLLNHGTSGSQACTTLTRLPDNTFVMVAECDIAAGEEILHSYGDSLTASHFLQTFGFVPATAVQAAAASSTRSTPNTAPVTPAILSKMEVLEACWIVIESNVPDHLAASMQAQEMEDEVWKVVVDRQRTADFISTDLPIALECPLTDELVTLACLPFLPVCAYQEAARNLLDKSILEDYYLGKLVCSSLIQAIQTKWHSYTSIRRIGVERQDHELLLELQQQQQLSNHLDVPSQRLVYGLVIRLEEKACLEALRKQVVGILARLDEDADLFYEESDQRLVVADAKKRPRPSE